MENGLYADILQLQEHVSKIRQEHAIAAQLCEHLRLARGLADPETVRHYDSLINQAARLADYFRLMSKTVENMAIELDRISLNTGRMLEESADYSTSYFKWDFE